MADDLTFTIASDTTPFDNGIRRGVIEPLEDADKALEKLGRTGDRELGDLEDEMSDARRDTEKFEDSIKDVSDALTRVGRTGRKSGDDIDDGFDKARKGADEFKDEANSTAKEAAASFDGSAESIGDAFQEIAANAFSGFGPAGAVAGTAAAIGLGAATAGFEKVEEEQRKSEERIAQWAEKFIEAGARVLSAATIIAESEDIMTDSERYKEAQEAADQWGVSIETAVQALAGSPSALRDVKTSLEEQRAALDAQAKAQGGANGETIKAYELNEIATQKYSDLATEIQNGADRADSYSRILRDVAETTVGATTEIDKFGDSVVTLPDGKQIYIDAETGQATQDVDAIENKVYGIRDKTVHVKVNTNTTDLDALEARLNRLNNSNFVFTVNPDGSIGRFLP